MRFFIIALSIAFSGCQPAKQETVVVEEELPAASRNIAGPLKLSEHSIFVGLLKNLRPASNVHPYEINSPLFSDYAFKKRMIRMPAGKQMKYDDREVFDFPEGTVLIKSFYYPADFRKPEAERRLLETRLLTLKNGAWEPLTYIWNDKQTEAFLEVAGRSLSVSWIHSDGQRRDVAYSVPDVNQCRGCHLKGQRVMPIGTSARQLNHDNQLANWQGTGLLAELPHGGAIPKLVSYEDPGSSITDRARAWLEVNCAHCHRPDGQGKTSGLHLAVDVTAALALGVGKAPVAAGKGSGGRRFGIVPGKPDESIIVFRIESTDPGIMMPEMGRKLAHTEGVALVRQWILEMK